MKRLLISALLAVLVHAYWLRSNFGESVGSSQGKVPESVVISLATTVRGSASGPGSEPDTDAEPTAQPGKSVPVATQPVSTERKDEPTDGVASVKEDGATTIGDRYEPEEDDVITADTPIIEHDNEPGAQGTPKTKAKTNQTRQVPREEKARNTRQRSQTVKSRSQTAKPKIQTKKSRIQTAKPKIKTEKPKSQTAKSTRIERENGRARLAKLQGSRYEPGDGAPNNREKAQPHPGARASRGTSITQALKGVLQKAQPLYKRNPRPPYPRVARRRGYEGTVIVKVLVGIDGLVNEVRLDESSGHGMLDGAALKTVQRWAFEPAVRGTEKVEMWVRIPLRFSLD